MKDNFHEMQNNNNKMRKKSKCKYDDDYTKIPINLRHKEREYEQKCKERLQLRRSYVA